MTLESQIAALATALGTNVKELALSRGTLANLTTVDKSSIVAAINELNSGLGSIDLTALIDDASTSTTKAWSADKITGALALLKSQILDGVDVAFDTLKEISDYLIANDGTLAALEAAIANRVRYDAAQALTDEQKATATTNIGIGDQTTDFLAIFEAAQA